jgi:hypothetical protein
MNGTQAYSRMLKRMWGSWDALSARATRGLRRPSLDARSGELIRAILETTYASKLGRVIVGGSLRPC